MFPLVLLAKDRTGYALLCELITQIHMQHPDGLPLERVQEAASRGDHLVCLTGGRAGFPTVLGESKGDCAGRIATCERCASRFLLICTCTCSTVQRPTSAAVWSICAGWRETWNCPPSLPPRSTWAARTSTRCSMP